MEKHSDSKRAPSWEDALRSRLAEEAETITFSEEMRQSVLMRAKPSFWEREIRIPLPVALVPILLVVTIGAVLFSRDGKPAQAYPQTRYVTLDSGVFNENDLYKGWK